MKDEIPVFLIVGSTCFAILIMAHHQHPECESAKDFWCEPEAPRLKDGHEREPMPSNTRAVTTMTIPTSASLA